VSALESSEISLLNLFAVTLFELMVINNWYVIMVSTVINLLDSIHPIFSSCVLLLCYNSLHVRSYLSLLCHHNVATVFTTLFVADFNALPRSTLLSHLCFLKLHTSLGIHTHCRHTHVKICMQSYVHHALESPILTNVHVHA